MGSGGSRGLQNRRLHNSQWQVRFLPLPYPLPAFLSSAPFIKVIYADTRCLFRLAHLHKIRYTALIPLRPNKKNTIEVKELNAETFFVTGSIFLCDLPVLCTTRGTHLTQRWPKL